MNGRLYDPQLGRFLSVDNVVQHLSRTRSYNSYSYCLNNPLKYADPDGYTRYIVDYPHPAHIEWGGSDGGGGGPQALSWGGVGIPEPMADNSFLGFMAAVLKSDIGGTWSHESGTTIFNTFDDAEQAVINFNNENNSWGAYATFMNAQYSNKVSTTKSCSDYDQTASLNDNR